MIGFVLQQWKSSILAIQIQVFHLCSLELCRCNSVIGSACETSLFSLLSYLHLDDCPAAGKALLSSCQVSEDTVVTFHYPLLSLSLQEQQNVSVWYRVRLRPSMASTTLLQRKSVRCPRALRNPNQSAYCSHRLLSVLTVSNRWDTVTFTFKIPCLLISSLAAGSLPVT